MTSIKNKDLDSILDNLFGTEKPKKLNNDDCKEIDLSKMFGGMIPTVPTQPLMGPVSIQKPTQHIPRQNIGQPSVVYLREGLKSYRKLEIDSPVPVAIDNGPIHGMIGKEFEYCGKIKVYLVENINKTIDLSKVDYNKFLNLVIVRAPFVGTLLVPEQALIKNQEHKQQLLKG